MAVNLKATIAICTYNRARLLELCIESIAFIDYNFSDFEVLVVDNNSTDNTAALCQTLSQKYPGLNFRYIVEVQQGVGYTRTRCAYEAKGDIIAFIDDDCLADRNWLKNILAFYNEHAEAMSTGGRIIPKYLTPKPNWFGKYFWGLVGNYEPYKAITRMTGVRYPSGANMHFRKSAFEKYGYFDGALGRSGKSLMAGEEKAMYLKLLQAKEAVYFLPHVIVHHHVEANKFDAAYVKRHSMGIGGSERIINQGSWWKLTLKFLEYVAKLGFAVAYGFVYLLQGHPSKMAMLIRFRWWVIRGFFHPSGAKGS